ncbi:MAG TPA: bifunctional phosphoribosylaminoimidazolecarboxamide formyltransferase/inosine monophosphate cyclohydrolase [Nitrospinae bacterium]|nr:bifunctional phosphoribosylaminoimidazolecarboxamide formyltransferase/inosine monophosphate cyclohydrolase [Nitrospinota bacterium]HBA27765.1 bifunctional phosphoribosylaminoimidazolecarboxamide formyltransferase/inosine monophosphate cyclohydrolase [Nitrospinota bacterium]
MSKIQRALVSVSKKDGLLDFAKGLNEMGVEILSTGGTAKILKDNNIPVIQVSDYTKFPEIMDGRVKTLHPLIHGGLLGKRDDKKHVEEMKKHGIKPIDMVVVNLYPFEETISKNGVTLDEAIENIDIGGPSMLRSSAKNFQDVAVVVDSDDYEDILAEMKENDGDLSYDTKMKLSVKAFKHTARYDSLISKYLESKVEGEGFPSILNLQYEKITDLRYGENPHQKASFYENIGLNKGTLSKAKQLHGKELSYNNILDLNAALELVREFDETAAVIIKHTNPCGVATGNSLVQAYRKARETDPLSAFGGIIAFNKNVDEDTAKEIASTFIEAVIVPDYDDSALAILKEKKNIRLLKLPDFNKKAEKEYDLRTVSGGILLQDKDSVTLNEDNLKIVTNRQPTEKEWTAMRFAWKVAKHVKSNAIIYAADNETVGIGAGQMSRVDSSKLAAMKANKPIEGTAMASDAFFPFRDSVDEAAKVGVTAIIQPGGSVKDEEVIAAANEHNIAMVFTGIRHFRH